MDGRVVGPLSTAIAPTESGQIDGNDSAVGGKLWQQTPKGTRFFWNTKSTKRHVLSLLGGNMRPNGDKSASFISAFFAKGWSLGIISIGSKL